MDKVQLMPYPHTMALGEAFQANSMKFAFLNPTDNGFQMVHAWVQCREYFNEMLMTNYHKDFQFQTTYGFDYRPKEFPLDLNSTRIAIKFMDSAQKQTFLDNIEWIHNIETVNNVELTAVHDVDKLEVVLIADKMWVQKCILVNIYTLLLKLAALDIKNLTQKQFKNLKVKDQTPSEVTYIQQISAPVFNSLVENCSTIAKIPTNYVDGSKTLRYASEVHANSGIIYLWRNLTNNNDMGQLFNQIKGLFNGKYKNDFIKAST